MKLSNEYSTLKWNCVILFCFVTDQHRYR